jgi:hypothetical protein
VIFYHLLNFIQTGDSEIATPTPKKDSITQKGGIFFIQFLLDLEKIT